MSSNSNIQSKSGTQSNWKHLADAQFQETACGTHALHFLSNKKSLEMAYVPKTAYMKEI